MRKRSGARAGAGVPTAEAGGARGGSSGGSSGGSWGSSGGSYGSAAAGVQRRQLRQRWLARRFLPSSLGTSPRFVGRQLRRQLGWLEQRRQRRLATAAAVATYGYSRRWLRRSDREATMSTQTMARRRRSGQDHVDGPRPGRCQDHLGRRPDEADRRSPRIRHQPSWLPVRPGATTTSTSKSPATARPYTQDRTILLTGGQSQELDVRPRRHAARLEELAKLATSCRYGTPLN